MTALTNAQAAFAAEHHELIYQFLNERHLPESEYYDTVVFAFLECITENTEEDFKKRLFSAMDAAVKKVQNEESPEIISLFDYDNSYLTVAESLSTQRDEIDEMLERIQTEVLLACFTKYEKEVINLLLSGFAVREIAFRLKQTVAQVAFTINQIKTKAGDILLPAAA